MTTAATPLRKDHTLTGAIVPLVYDWKISAASELLVTLVNTVAIPNVETTLTLSDYSVSGVGASNGGTVIPNLAYTAGWKIVITNNVAYEQDTDFTNQNSVKPEVVEAMGDKIVKQVKQLVEQMSRAVLTTIGSGISPANLISTLLSYVSQAAISAGTATTQAGIATTQAGIATTQATIATDAVQGIPYRDAVFLTFANSPRTMTNADRGKLFVIDTSGGNFVFNMAQISTLTMPFTVGIKKDTADANTVTVNRAGTDTIDGATSYTISTVGGANFIGDTDPTPDRWVTASFGASTGQSQNQTFTGGVDFTGGTTTQLTLTTSPIAASSASLSIYFDGIRQFPSEWSYVPGTGVITFSSAIPVGVSKVYTGWASTTVAIGTPSNGTVDYPKIASGAIATTADIKAGTASKLVDAAGLAATPLMIQRVITNLATVVTGNTQIPNDDSIPQITEGFEVITATITPLAGTNKIEISGTIHFSPAAAESVIIAIFKDAGANAIAAFQSGGLANATVVSVPFKFVVDAGGTAAQTYRVRIGPISTTTTVTVNGIGGTRRMGGVLVSELQLIERRP